MKVLLLSHRIYSSPFSFHLPDLQTPKWKKHRKHMFIMSSAGKPIYCRYGDESRLADFIGVLSGLVSFVSDREGDEIQSITTATPRGAGMPPLTIVFKTVGPIWLVMATRSGESFSILTQQLVTLHSQIISILTGSVQKILSQKPQFDIRNLLVGTDKCFDSLCGWMNSSAAFLLNCVHGLRLTASLRLAIGNILLQSRRGDLFYAIMLARGQLVQLLRPRSFILYPPDLHLIINFVTSSDSSFRTSEAQWTPICLPMFNDRGFLHQYISYISDDVALLLLSSKAEDFYAMQQSKDAIVDAMRSTGALDNLTNQLSRQYYSVKDVPVPGLLHFLYKSLSTSQMTAPAPGPPYTSRQEQKRLFRLYEHVHRRTHPHPVSSTAFHASDNSASTPTSSTSASASSGTSGGSSSAVPSTSAVSSASHLTHRVYYHVSEKETIVAWTTAGFELYAVFGPLESKAVCIRGCNQLLKWIKQEESSLFILDSPVW
jgi:vacuolar fusion protein MON1